MGAKKNIVVNFFEKNHVERERCLKKHGYRWKVYIQTTESRLSTHYIKESELDEVLDIFQSAKQMIAEKTK